MDIEDWLIRKFYYYLFASCIRTASLRLLYVIFISSDHCATSPRNSDCYKIVWSAREEQELGAQVQGIVSQFKLVYLGLSALSKYIGFFLSYFSDFSASFFFGGLSHS